MTKKEDWIVTKQVSKDPSVNLLLESSQEDVADQQFVAKIGRNTTNYRLWIVFLACCVLHFVIFGMHYSFGAVFAKLLLKFNKGQGKTAWVGSLASASMFFWAVLSAKLSDFMSVPLTCLCGSIIGGTGLILTSFASRLEVLYVTHSLLFGLGTSLMYTPSLIVVARYYGKWRSLVTGVVVGCGSLGQLVLSPLLNYLVVTHGVSLTFRWLGSVFVASSILSSLSFYLLDRKSGERSEAIKNNWEVTRRLFANKSFLLWILIMMLCNFTYYIPLIHLSKYAEEFGTDAQDSTLLLTAIASSAMLGRVCFGKISNYRPEITMAVYQFSMFISGTLTLFASMSTTFWHLILYSIAYGFLDGSFIGLISIVTMQIVGLADMAQGWSVMLFSISFPIALGPAAVGWINDSSSLDGRALFYLSGIPMIFGSVLMLLVRNWQKEQHESTETGDCLKNEFQPMLQLVTVL